MTPSFSVTGANVLVAAHFHVLGPAGAWAEGPGRGAGHRSGTYARGPSTLATGSNREHDRLVKGGRHAGQTR